MGPHYSRKYLFLCSIFPLNFSIFPRQREGRRQQRDGKLSIRDQLRGGYVYGVAGVAYPSSPPLPSKAGSRDEIVLPITDSPAGPALAPWPTASKLFPPFLGSLTGYFFFLFIFYNSIHAQMHLVKAFGKSKRGSISEQRKSVRFSPILE